MTTMTTLGPEIAACLGARWEQLNNGGHIRNIANDPEAAIFLYIVGGERIDVLACYPEYKVGERRGQSWYPDDPHNLESHCAETDKRGHVRKIRQLGRLDFTVSVSESGQMIADTIQKQFIGPYLHLLSKARREVSRSDAESTTKDDEIKRLVKLSSPHSKIATYDVGCPEIEGMIIRLGRGWSIKLVPISGGDYAVKSPGYLPADVVEEICRLAGNKKHPMPYCAQTTKDDRIKRLAKLAGPLSEITTYDVGYPDIIEGIRIRFGSGGNIKLVPMSSGEYAVRGPGYLPAYVVEAICRIAGNRKDIDE